MKYTKEEMLSKVDHTLLKPDATVLVDVKGIVDKAAAEAAGLRFWRL